MKRTNSVFMVLFIVTVFLLSATNVWAQAAPAFDQQPSVIFDLWSNSKNKYSDNIKLINAASLQNITFNVWGYDEKKKEWTLIGTSTLKGHSDSDQVEKPRGVNIKSYRWFALHSPSTIQFDAQAMANDSHDIIILVLDKVPTAAAAPQGDNAPAFDLPSSTLLDLKGKGRYKENIDIKNGLGGTNLAFNVWGYDQKNNQWRIIGCKKLSPDPAPPKVFTGWGWYDPADASVDTPWKDRLNEFRWIAVQSVEGLAFNAQATISSNDITVTVLKK